MRKNLIGLTFIAASVVLFSCKSADNRAPEIATDFCNCFTEIEQNFSADTKRIVSTAASAADPTKSLQDQVIALADEKKEQVGKEMESLGDMEDENSKIGKCMKDVEKKYKNVVTFNEGKTFNKIIAELEKKKGCDFTAALMKIGMRMKDGGDIK
jgi:hypothetical protein